MLALGVSVLLAACSPAPARASLPLPNQPGAAAVILPSPTLRASPTLPEPASLPLSLTSTPTPTPIPPTAAAAPCLSQPGELVDSQLVTDQMPEPLPFRVYLPPCYQAGGSQRYPVLYLLNGQDYSDDQWTRLGIATTADRLIASARIPPLIIVMPGDSDWRQPNESPFGDVLVEELVPWIDAHYPTLADRQARAIGGLSRGAAWAIHLGLEDWALFGAIGAHSLPLFWDDDDEKINEWLDAIPPISFPRIYLDISTKDLDLRSNQAFESLLTARGVPHEWHLFVGYHDETYWSAHLEAYLLWYSRGWARQP